ncbi:MULTISPECIES: cAMP-activated global transcriptional regulator CRP [Methylotuvimicrobium]|uniref:Catabolite gene activator n=2 Tax=Methylotuvimicrobium TaxID=2822410 RepID=G4STQ5_META2|nr:MULTISPECIES: cAMP-activated global transcriptional regulator CRP [Methylotuvimicrobium]MBE0436146.1 cAMP-activated global transcriptional regulator CRP [Methylomicrobium sp.]MBU2570832.1 cAMP-activated global transcriptional regulator CRP [Gammaproteobacteria bacterium]PKM36046.1 MAG: cAMP-activated global transcriptional regulator CRP [Gammaproteobacteria bacterium HGW-Gammaproteobacteria-10]HBA66980.1 cAMP-activated global transcriptional regulator CRP [Methylococcaceae bacterium]QCW8083
MTPSKLNPAYRDALEPFLHLCHTKSYPAKTTIIRPGDTGDRLYFIIEGSVSIGVEDEDGRELILAYLNKHDFIGEIGVFKPTDTREVSVNTRTPCKLAEIGYERLKQALKKELLEYAPEILSMLGEQLASRLLITSRKFRDLAFMDVEGRIARTLLDLAKEPDAVTHPDGMQLRITRQEIGRIVGCSREMAGRVLKELEDKGLITAHGKTIVVFGTR